MKRIVALALTLALTLALSACGGGASLVTEETETLIRTSAAETETGGVTGVHDATGFCVGFGRGDITPTLPTPLGGYGASAYRLSQNVLDELYATCVAIRDEDGETLLLFHLDLLVSSKSLSEQARTMITGATGVPGDHVLFTATHTHAGPDVDSSEGAMGTWKGKAYKAILSAAKDAVAYLDHCRIYVGSAEADGLNFVRRYVLENGYSSPHGSIGSGAVVAHEGEIDREMRVVRFVRDNQPDVVLANWQCHATMTGGSAKTDVSADFVGQLRKNAERELGIKFLYFQGGAGNVSPATKLPGETAKGGDYKNEGKQLFSVLKEALDGAAEVQPGKVLVRKAEIEGKVNHELDALAPVCDKINAMFTANDRAGAEQMTAANGLSSAYEARAILRRSKLGATEPFSVYVCSFGDVAFAMAPFEMFCQTYTDLRAASPFAMTFTCGYSNASCGYMPAADCFDHKGYEVWTCTYVAGTAEQITAKQLELLNEMKTK